MKNTKNKEIVEVETFPNPFSGRDYIIDMESREFTCLCPKTGQPDFATLYISYVPKKKCIELKSLKIYLTSYRNEGGFHEKVVNIILDDLVSACNPKNMKIVGDFNIRGGIHTKVTAEYSAGKTSSRKRKK